MTTQTDFTKAVAVLRMKRAAGRPKDFEILAQLQALLEETNKPLT